MNTKVDIKPRLLSTAQAAEYLGVSASAIRRLLYSGKIKTVAIMSHLRYDVQDLDTLINASKETK